MTTTVAIGWLLAGVLGSGVAFAAESVRVYRHVSADGVVTFSDEPRDDAEIIDLPSTEPSIEDVERADAAFRRQLALIEVLEQSRHDREDQAARSRELDIAIARAEAARAAAEAAAALEDARYVYDPWYAPGYPAYGPGHGWPGRPGRPDKDGREHERPRHDRPGHGAERPLSRPLGVKPN